MKADLAIANAQVASVVERAAVICEGKFADSKSGSYHPYYKSAATACAAEIRSLVPPDASLYARVIEAAQSALSTMHEQKRRFARLEKSTIAIDRAIKDLSEALAALKAKETPDGQ